MIKNHKTHLTILIKTFISILLILNITGCSEYLSDAPQKTQTTSAQGSTVSFINVGQGDSTLIQSNGKTVLFDAGHGGSYDDACLDFLESQSIATLDYLILSHPDADHINDAADVLKNIDVKNIYMNDYVSSSKTYENLLKTIQQEGLAIDVPDVGDTIELDNAVITFISVGSDANDSNNSSLCITFDDGYNQFLFTGDADASVETNLVNSGKIPEGIDVLKAGHHGSKYSNSEILLNAIKSPVVIISCGIGNSYGHPNEEALNRFQKTNMTIYRTDKDGSIIVESNQEGLQISTK